VTHTSTKQNQTTCLRRGGEKEGEEEEGEEGEEGEGEGEEVKVVIVVVVQSRGAKEANLQTSQSTRMSTLWPQALQN